MWDLSTAPWELVVRGATIYFALMILIRLSGKRTVGEFTPFDIIVLLLISEAAQGGLTAGDESITGTLILCTTLIALNFALGFISARSKTVDKVLEGEPVLLMRNGKLLKTALLRNNVPEEDLDEAIRRQGAKSRDEVKIAVLEVSGEITVTKKGTDDG